MQVERRIGEAWDLLVQQQLSEGVIKMLEFRCEYEEDGERRVISGYLRDIQRTVGSRHVVLDGVPGHFEIADDEHASPQFIKARVLQ
jgi:hypothetical protein